MSLPISVILKELETAPSDIIEIVSSLRSDKTILQGISKVQRKHLVSRTLALSKSPKEYNKWCGNVIIRAIGDDFEILANEGVNILAQTIKNLENYNATINVKILLTTIDAINFVSKNIRGKPTLTREILTPKLSTIISLYIEKLQYHPYLIIESLRNILRHHPTTFRPFGNKLASILTGLLNLPQFCSFPQHLQDVIYETLAALPAIEKTAPEATWETNVRDLVKQIKAVASIYQEFINFQDDQELLNLIKKIPELDQDLKGLLPDLHIDINEPTSIYQISQRLEILLSLLLNYITKETQFTVKIPLGMILTVIQVICSINTKFLAFKYDVRESDVKNIIKSSTLRNHLNCVQFITQLVNTYKGNILPHINSILSTIEVLIPFEKKQVDYQQLLSNEDFYGEILTCIEACLSLTGNWGDSSILLRFIDVALFLVEPRVDNIQNPVTPVANGQKLKKKKNHNSVPLSDLLSHQHLFMNSVPKCTIESVRRFLNRVIITVNLPLTYHYKIMRYLVIEAVNAKHYNHEHELPKDLRTLLINSVIYPGFEKVSILPIVSTILKNDHLLSVFNNPRFPPLPIYIKKASLEEVEQEEDDEDEEMEEEDENVQENQGKEEPSPKRRKIDEDYQVKNVEEANPAIVNTVTEIPESFKSINQLAEETKITPKVEKTEVIEKTVGSVVAEEDDDSDSDAPALNLEDSDEE